MIHNIHLIQRHLEGRSAPGLMPFVLISAFLLSVGGALLVLG